VPVSSSPQTHAAALGPGLLRLTPRTVLAAILLAALATIGGALIFEHGLGLRPCKLCLQQRIPYYVAMAVAAGGLLLPPRWQRAALLVLALVLLVGAGMGVHHAGVEWGLWPGPNDCGGTPAPQAGSMGDFLNQLQTTRVVSCTEAAWRFLGLSLAGWNAVISLALALFALVPALRLRA
jgi:disulfide bond formation protein DsbB